MSGFLFMPLPPPINFDWLSRIFQHATANIKRSSGLDPLWWIILLQGIFVFASCHYGIKWLCAFFAVCFAAFIALYIFAYLFLMFRNPDLLRSEQHSIEKFRIEKGILGDSQTGQISVQNQRRIAQIEKEEEGKE